MLAVGVTDSILLGSVMPVSGVNAVCAAPFTCNMLSKNSRYTDERHTFVEDY